MTLGGHIVITVAFGLFRTITSRVLVVSLRECLFSVSPTRLVLSEHVLRFGINKFLLRCSTMKISLVRIIVRILSRA